MYDFSGSEKNAGIHRRPNLRYIRLAAHTWIICLANQRPRCRIRSWLAAHADELVKSGGLTRTMCTPHMNMRQSPEQFLAPIGNRPSRPWLTSRHKKKFLRTGAAELVGPAGLTNTQLSKINL